MNLNEGDEATATAEAGAGTQAEGVDALGGEEVTVTDGSPEHKITEARAKKGLLPRTAAMIDQALADLEAPKVVVADHAAIQAVHAGGNEGGSGVTGGMGKMGDKRGKDGGGGKGSGPAGEGGEPGEGGVKTTGGSNAASDGDTAVEVDDSAMSTTITVTHMPKAPPNRNQVAEPTVDAAGVDDPAMGGAEGSNNDTEGTSSATKSKLRARPNALELALTESMNRPSAPGPTIDGGGGIAAAAAAAVVEVAEAAWPTSSTDLCPMSPLTPKTFNIVVTRTPRMTQESDGSEATDSSLDARADALVKRAEEREKVANDVAERSGERSGKEGETGGGTAEYEDTGKAKGNSGLKGEPGRMGGDKSRGGERRARIATAEEEARTREKERDLDTRKEVVLENERDELRTFLTEDTVRQLLSQVDPSEEPLLLEGPRAEQGERFSGNALRSRAQSGVSELTADSAVRATTPNTHFTFVLPSPKAVGSGAAVHDKTDGEMAELEKGHDNRNPILSS